MVLTERKVADGVIENDARRCRTFTFRRAREDKTEINDEQDGDKASGRIHDNVQIKYYVRKRREGAKTHLLN